METEYVYLPTEDHSRIEREKLLGVVQEIVDADGGNVNMKDIATRHGLNRSERHAVETYLSSVLVLSESEIYGSFLPCAEIVRDALGTDGAPLPEGGTKAQEGTPDDKPVSAALLQRLFSLSYPRAEKLMAMLAECGLSVRNAGGKCLFICERRSDREHKEE